MTGGFEFARGPRWVGGCWAETDAVSLRLGVASYSDGYGIEREAGDYHRTITARAGRWWVLLERRFGHRQKYRRVAR